MSRLSSYLVLASAFSIAFILAGTTKSFGVLLPSLMEQLNADTWIIGSSYSITPIAGGVVAPLAGFLSRQFTSRYVAMFSGFIVLLSYVGCSFASRPAHLVVPFIVAGAGRQTIKVLSMTMVADHFDASFGKAIGFVSCGFSIGVIIMAPISQIFLDAYGLSGALVLLGAINAHLVICGVVLIPPETIASHQYELMERKTDGETKRPKDDFVRSIQRLLQTIIESLHLSIFRNISYLQVLIFHAIYSACIVTWITYLVSLAEDKGISPYLSAIVASIGGFGSMAGKMVTPFIIDRDMFPGIAVYYVTFPVICLSLVGHAVLSSFGGLLGASLVFGISSGALSVTIYKDCKTSIDGDKMAEAMAWMEVAHLISGSLSTIMTGRIIDAGSYTTSFLILAMIPLIGVMILIVDGLYNRCIKKRND